MKIKKILTPNYITYTDFTVPAGSQGRYLTKEEAKALDKFVVDKWDFLGDSTVFVIWDLDPSKKVRLFDAFTMKGCTFIRATTFWDRILSVFK